MKKQAPSKSILFLTSDQFEDAVVRGYQRFIQSTSRLYQANQIVKAHVLIQVSKQEGKNQPDSKTDSLRQNWDKKRAHKKLVLKGHVPIRSQIGQDRNRA